MKRKRISQSSSASTSSTHAYDVFLNFRGSDFRYSFVDCLYESLTASGIRVFMDDEALRVGDDIGDELLAAIDSSRLYVPVFSRNYASSKWCLIELARMVKCARKSDGKEILPMFLDVEPEDVRLKKELYAEDLLRHEERFGRYTVRKWRKALQKVSKKKGWNWQSNHGQGKLIKRIVRRISRSLELKHRILPDHFIGMEEQIQDIMNALDCRSSDVRIVVIHGMGGIGKTTLAGAVFNKICQQFQGCSFLSNVRESSAGNGIVNLQNRLLGDTLRFSSPKFCDVNDAMNCIQGSLQNKDVLVVLDDVSDMDQIKKLIGMGEWVGSKQCLNSLEMNNLSGSLFDITPIKCSQEVIHMPSSICNLKALSRLVIQGFKMKQLPENIGELKGLMFMEISGCELLRNLPDSIGDLESLCELVLSGNGITKLPESIGKLRNLTELDVSNNRLRRLPKTIGELERLEILDARHNNDLEGNGITELPESIGKLRNLTELDVSNNRLRSLPATIGDLERLVTLDASHNSDLQGEIPDEFGKLQSLTYLHLSRTGIHGLPSSIVQLSCLESLSLQNCNEIQELPNLPVSLIVLGISSGSLKVVPDLSSLTNLVDLSLSNRDVDDVGRRWDNSRVLSGNMMAWIQHLQELEYLKVDLSPMSPCLSAGLDQLSQLRSLNLSCPNPSVLNLPSGLEYLSLYHSMSLSRWERLSNLECLSTLNLYKSVATEIRLDGLKSLKNLTRLEIEGCEFLERVHDISRLQNLRVLHLSDCPQLVETRGLVQLLGSLQRLQIKWCDSIRCLPRPSSTESPPSELHLSVVNCRELQDFDGRYISYFAGGEQ